MDPSPRGTYRSANNRDDDGVVRIVVDIFDQTPPNYNNTVSRSDVVAGAPAPGRRRPEIEWNNPAKHEDDSPVHAAPVVEAPVQQAPVDDYSEISLSTSRFDLPGTPRPRSNYGSDTYRSCNYGSGNYGGSSYGNSSGDGYVDWARGSIDVAPDGKLAFYENAHPPTEPARGSHGETRFDLNAAVREAQERDEAYCQERLENLRKGKAMEDQDQFLNMSFRNSSPAEDPDYYRLWND